MNKWEKISKIDIFPVQASKKIFYYYVSGFLSPNSQTKNKMKGNWIIRYSSKLISKYKLKQTLIHFQNVIEELEKMYKCAIGP